MFGVSPIVEIEHADENDKEKLQISYLRSIQVCNKTVNMCCMIDKNIISTCSRLPIIKFYNLNDGNDSPLFELIGHEMGV